MSDIDTPRLRDCLARYHDIIPGLPDPATGPAAGGPAALIERYDRCYPLLEKAMWSGAAEFEPLLECYQSLFREQDALIRQQARIGGKADDRHRFLLVIPVADRPAHLRACLESIWQLCECFGYGGNEAGAYEHVRVIVAEDSRGPDNVRRHIALAEEYTRKGLQVVHFGQAEQYELLQSIPRQHRDMLGNLLTTQPRDRFWLKGQAANRNLGYLKCLQLAGDDDRILFHFVDSDESFCVNRPNGDGEEAVCAVNYFHYIDRLFRTTDTLLLTGKMVGDPPVSPAVMTANFLDDVIGFFSELAQAPGTAPCRFHAPPPAAASSSSAIYHDMPGLFGFDNRDTAFPYRCRLAGAHDHRACLRDFAPRLPAFFFGEHLFRRTFFAYGNGFVEPAPARTVYPGNYVVNREGLKYVIPFGHLRLRMSGPTAGRLIAAEIGPRFASANLPHLHRRTTGTELAGAFRPGVELAEKDAQAHVDLSSEFERQFFGDLMLFTTEALVAETGVTRPFAADRITRIMDEKEAALLALYREKHDAIRDKVRRLERLVFDDGHWWQNDTQLAETLNALRGFIDNVDHNFGDGSPAWELIQSAAHRAGRKRQITDALLRYRAERDAWERLVRNQGTLD